MSTDRSRPDLDDTTVEGLGKLSEALETIEQARGQLYGFHQHSGKADLLLQDAVELLPGQGEDLAAQIHLIIDGMYLSGGLLGPDGPASHGRALAERLIEVALQG